MNNTSSDGFSVSGIIMLEGTKTGVSGLRVEAWDRDLIFDDMVGCAETDSEGRFLIAFESRHFKELFENRKPDLYFKIYLAGRLLKSTEDAVLWNQADTQHFVRIEVSLPGSPETRSRIPISGTVFNEANGHPLAKLTVKVVRVPPAQGHDRTDIGIVTPKGPLIGERSTDFHGWFLFLIDVEDLAGDDYVLVFETRDGNVLLVSDPFTAMTLAERQRVAIAIDTPSVEVAVWKQLAQRLQETRIVRLHELAHYLTFPESGTAPFGDWNQNTRHAVLNTLEQEFLDATGVLREYDHAPTFYTMRRPECLRRLQSDLEPHQNNPDVKRALTEMLGKLQTFDSLLDVDWVIDPGSFATGDTNAAVNLFAKAYAVTEISPDSIADDLQIPSDLSRYRDYLLAIFTGPPDTEAYTNRRAQLERRFHQNFSTLDTGEVPANAILIPILKNILASPTGEAHGFGILPSQIEYQGERTDRAYLDYLVGITGLEVIEFGLRYRIDLQRPDTAMSSPVQENIATLQSFYRDSYQCDPEPHPIIPDHLQGKAPFFLYFDEWIEYHKLFHPENYYGFKGLWDTTLGLGQTRFEWVAKNDPSVSGIPDDTPDLNSLARALTKTREGHDFRALGELSLAFDCFRQASAEVDRAGQGISRADIEEAFAQIDSRATPLYSLDDLLEYSTQIYTLWGSGWNPGQGSQSWHDWAVDNRRDFIRLIALLEAVILPIYTADTLLAQGDYRNAVYHYGRLTGFPVGMAKEENYAGYRDYLLGTHSSHELFHAGGLPYTANVSAKRGYPLKPYFDSKFWYSGEEALRAELELISLVMGSVHPMVARFARLRHANAMLEWADSLYRANDEPSISRAREQYKAVLFLHGDPPAIAPDWPREWSVVPIFWRQGAENPALTAQKSRARLGIYQIDHGLNVLGLSEDMVPSLRYRPLKEAAERFANAAKSAQQDFLQYTSNVENMLEAALRERLMTENALKRAGILGKIAMEQRGIADHAVQQAEKQVTAVLGAIQAKQDEIDDSDSLFSQFKDFGEGFVDAVSDPEKIAAGVAAGNLATGYGMFVYGSYSSMSGMETAANGRKSELNALKYQDLPTARALVDVRMKERHIADLQYQLALSEAEFAAALFAAIRHFQQHRFLNVELWARLAGVMKHLMRRYLELGARHAWLAERALAHEQGRPVRIVRFDYFPESLQGVTGADLLLLDLAELEASWLDNLSSAIPIRQTCSLAFDYPLQLAQLKKTGQCRFRTDESALQQAYPGCYGYRVQSLVVAVQSAGASLPILGYLKNDGVSAVSTPDGEKNLIRIDPGVMAVPANTVPGGIVHDDKPSISLGAFEGLGFETTWTLELPRKANADNLNKVLDIQVMFELRARYSDDLYRHHLASVPKNAQRMILLSARQLLPDSLAALQSGEPNVSFQFKVQTVGLPKNEANRRVKNLMLVLGAGDLPQATLSLRSETSQSDIPVIAANGFASSNLGPLAGSGMASALNAFHDEPLDQTFEVKIESAANPNVDFGRVRDLVLGIEYLADIP